MPSFLVSDNRERGSVAALELVSSCRAFVRLDSACGRFPATARPRYHILTACNATEADIPQLESLCDGMSSAIDVERSK